VALAARVIHLRRAAGDRRCLDVASDDVKPLSVIVNDVLLQNSSSLEAVPSLEDAALHRMDDRGSKP